MKRRIKKRLRRWAARAAAGLWVATSGWFVLTSYQGPYDYSQAYGGCTGTFQERAHCTTTNVLADDRRMFANGVVKLAIVVVPAIGIHWAVETLLRPRRRTPRHTAA